MVPLYVVFCVFERPRFSLNVDGQGQADICSFLRSILPQGATSVAKVSLIDLVGLNLVRFPDQNFICTFFADNSVAAKNKNTWSSLRLI